jgi:hypothetical protein
MAAKDATFQNALSTLLVEVFAGPPGKEAYILNPGDPGLLTLLEGLDARAAGRAPGGGRKAIAAHADHVRYGIALLNRWAAGEPNPWADADWEASWLVTVESDEQWRALCATLRQEVESWQRAVASRNDWEPVAAAGALSSLAHTAYHLGAIRQIVLDVRGLKH